LFFYSLLPHDLKKKIPSICFRINNVVIYNNVHEMQLSVNHLYLRQSTLSTVILYGKSWGKCCRSNYNVLVRKIFSPKKLLTGGREEEKRGGRIGAPKGSDLFGGPEKEWLPAYLLRRTEEPFEFERRYIMSSSDKNVCGTIN
jgi:hypothetical protein